MTHKVLDVRRLYLKERGRTVEGNWWMVERGAGRRTGSSDLVVEQKQRSAQTQA